MGALNPPGAGNMALPGFDLDPSTELLKGMRARRCVSGTATATMLRRCRPASSLPGEQKTQLGLLRTQH